MSALTVTTRTHGSCCADRQGSEVFLLSPEPVLLLTAQVLGVRQEVPGSSVAVRSHCGELSSGSSHVSTLFSNVSERLICHV